MSTNTKVGNKANTRKTTESGGEVLKNLTRLWPGSSSTGQIEVSQTKEGTGGKRKRKEQRGWKGVCTKDRGEEEAGSPDQSSIRTARHRGEIRAEMDER